MRAVPDKMGRYIEMIYISERNISFFIIGYRGTQPLVLGTPKLITLADLIYSQALGPLMLINDA